MFCLLSIDRCAFESRPGRHGPGGFSNAWPRSDGGAYSVLRQR
jgi:hypothetical protein